MNPSIASGLASIIVPCFNQEEFTRLCIRALLRHTRRSWELIVVDNGSTDDTNAYLRGVQDAAPVPVTIIRNTRNLGFPRAINQGLREARGEYLVLLNNDAVVTDDWLEQLVGLAEMTGQVQGKPEVGLVGPMSNYAAPPQLVQDVPYRDLDEMHAFALRWRDQHRGRWLTAPKLSGFCLLMKRAVYEAIGGLDERFGLGLFDDDDLAERARLAGFGLAVAHDLFIHHYGSRTFAGNGIDAESLLEENARRFADKWGDGAPRGQRVGLQPWSGATRPLAKTQDTTSRNGAKPAKKTSKADSEHRKREETSSQGPFAPSRPGERSSDSQAGAAASDHGERARVSLTMIVRNEEANLPNALESARGLFDEMVVVDTGSTDRTKEIAREFGAKVFDFAWIDDFAAARNAALSRATGDYAFWLDADDVLEAPQRKKLEDLLNGLRADDPAAYVLRCACDQGRNRGAGIIVVDHIRLFPLREGVRWTYRVHEQILPALRKVAIPVRWTDLVVRHTGYADPVLRSRKLDRDAKILMEELAKRPADPFVLFNLGSIAVEREQWPAALDYLGRSLAGSAPTDSIRRKLHALIARSHQMLGDLPTALRTCAEGLSLDPEDAELLFRKGVLHRHRGELAEAESCWRPILGLHRPERFCSVDQGIFGHLTRRNLAALAEERADHAEAARLWREVLAECPGDPEAMHKLDQLERDHFSNARPGASIR
jgi:glycosyltransferase involved in cell wall biosynthesis